MATPRKHWFRVEDSVLNESWDNDALATMVRLCAYLNTRWARDGLDAKEASRGFIPDGALMLITGTKRRDYARKATAKLAALTGLRIAYYHDSIAFSWPKYAITQGLAPRESPASLPRVAPSATSPARRNKTHSSSVSTRTRKRAAIPFPVELSDEDRKRLRSWADEKQIPLEFVRDKIEDLRLWAQGKDERKVDWVAAIQGAVRRDWKEKQREANQPQRGDDTIAGAVARITARRGLRSA